MDLRYRHIPVHLAPAGRAGRRHDRAAHEPQPEKGEKVYISRTNLCTRIYPKGYGEGDNQLTIASVNGGVDYLDADTQGTYGIVARQYVDTTFTNPSLLLAVATKILQRDEGAVGYH